MIRDLPSCRTIPYQSDRKDTARAQRVRGWLPPVNDDSPAAGTRGLLLSQSIRASAVGCSAVLGVPMLRKLLKHPRQEGLEARPAGYHRVNSENGNRRPTRRPAAVVVGVLGLGLARERHQRLGYAQPPRLLDVSRCC